MSILILTGVMAYEILEEYITPFANSVKLMKLPISIAAFITPQFVINQLKKIDFSPYKSIIVPGLMQGSTQSIEDVFNIPTFKGPRYASDIPLILEENLQLSKTIPADKLLLNRGFEEYDKIISKITETTPPHPFIRVKSYRIGIDYPPYILAEIVDAPKLSLQKIISKSQYFLKNGAHMIDIGAMVGQNNAKIIGKIIEEVKSKLKVPISIDSMLPEEIEVAVDAGADVILSLDAGNMKDLKNLPKDRIVTIIPTNVKEGIFPKSPNERIKLLLENINNAKKLGFDRILVDPLLESPITPGLTKSLETFIQFRKKEPHIPLLFGGGNISELIDADSIGVNALLACIAVELGISVILTTEYSNKTRNSINELSIGLKMAFLANYKKRPPTGLPFHLLRAKSKKRYDH
ncbi:MAG: dihydropteroate synthase-like protein, partial [Candidatus Helarchaeota archaeon]|nr:dihydropteroate synthase-like protein [Candidatus Helarchaeota archaeon]